VDRLLIRLLPSLVIVAFLGAAICAVQILRSVLGDIRYEQSAPSQLINCAFLLFLSWTEARSFVGSLHVGREQQPLGPEFTARGGLALHGSLDSLFFWADRYADCLILFQERQRICA
jgi:hypothetical protein